MDVTVPDPMRDWVRQRIESGEYASASDYVGELIRRDRAEAGERQGVVEALLEGEASGISGRRLPDIVAAAKREAARRGP